MNEANQLLVDAPGKVNFPQNGLDRFWSKVEKIGPDGCWIWTDNRLISGGYGQISIFGKPSRAHVISWMIANGEIPAGLCVLHKCDIAACCNPAHLWLGTQFENIQDMNRKGRHGHWNPVGELHPGVKLTEEQVREIRLRYSHKERSQYKLADEYGVSRSCIMQITSRRNWSHVN